MSFLAIRVRLWSDRPVTILKDFVTLSGLLVNIKSIWVCEDDVILVGPLISCVKSNWFETRCSALLVPLSSQLTFKSPITSISCPEPHSFRTVSNLSKKIAFADGGLYFPIWEKDICGERLMLRQICSSSLSTEHWTSLHDIWSLMYNSSLTPHLC